MDSKNETSDGWSFVYVADMQPGSPKSFRFNPAWGENWKTARLQIRALRPDFLLIGGDVTRDGALHRWELEEMKADFDGMGIPYHVIPGNMDTGNKHAATDGASREDQEPDTRLNITSAHLRQFSEVFGPLWWSFVHRGVRFSGCADMVINSGLPEEQAFWAWADRLSAEPRETRHVWLTHYPLFIHRPDEANWDNRDPTQRIAWYFSIDRPGRDRLIETFRATGVTLSIAGHVHCFKRFEFDGIRYVIAPSPSFSQLKDHWPDGDTTLGFLHFDVTGAGLRETRVPLDVVSSATGAYGPGGHPRSDLRDYSRARG